MAVEACPSDHARRTFDAFAPYYDTFTSEHRHDEWTANLESLAIEWGLEGNRLLDVACGTGKSFLPMLDRGYDVVACDVSPAMVAQARLQAAGRADVVVADVRDLPVLGEFDLAFALCDVVNYVLLEEELERAFVGVMANLRPGGILVFDANTVCAFREFFSSTEVISEPGRTLIWQHGTTKPMWRERESDELEAGDLVRNVLTAFEAVEGDQWRRTLFEHFERHHPDATVRRCMAAAGLDCLGIYGQTYDGNPVMPLDESSHTKAVYVAQRPR